MTDTLSRLSECRTMNSVNSVSTVLDRDDRAECSTVITVKKQRNLKPWKAGKSGNPRGRPKGSRHKFSEQFLSDVLEAWNEQGPQVLQRVIKEDPAAYLRAMIAILPKEHNVKINKYDGLDADQLKHAFASALAEARKLGIEMPVTEGTA